MREKQQLRREFRYEDESFYLCFEKEEGESTENYLGLQMMFEERWGMDNPLAEWKSDKNYCYYV